jgi:hypothetical protein
MDNVHLFDKDTQLSMAYTNKSTEANERRAVLA